MSASVRFGATIYLQFYPRTKRDRFIWRFYRTNKKINQSGYLSVVCYVLRFLMNGRPTCRMTYLSTVIVVP